MHEPVELLKWMELVANMRCLASEALEMFDYEGRASKAAQEDETVVDA